MRYLRCSSSVSALPVRTTRFAATTGRPFRVLRMMRSPFGSSADSGAGRVRALAAAGLKLVQRYDTRNGERMNAMAYGRFERQ